MEKSKEEVSVCRISESTATLNENGARETLEESVHCASQGQVEGLGGEDAGGGSEKDIMVEVLGSDVYIDGVCTRANEAELRDEVACGGSVDGGNDMKSLGGDSGVGNEAEAGFEASHLQSLEAKSENPAQHDVAALGKEDVSSGTLKDGNVERGEDVPNMQGAPVLKNGAQKEEMGTGVSGSLAVVNSTLEETELPMAEDVRLEHNDAQEAAVPDDKLTNPLCDNALGGSTAVSSLNGENVHSESVERDSQQQKNLVDQGAREGRNDVTLKSCDRQKKIANEEGDKTLKEEACIYDKDENTKINATDEKLQSAEEQSMDIDKVGENSSSLPKVVSGVEVDADKDCLNSDKCIRNEKCKEKKMISDASYVSSDTGQGMEIDKDSHSESLALHGRGQNSENYKTEVSSMHRDAQVCNVGEISLIKRDGVTGCVLSERPQSSEHSIEIDIDSNPDLVDSGSREQGRLDGNVSDVKHVILHKGEEEEAEDHSARVNRGSGNANIQGTSVSFGVVGNLEAITNSRSVENNQTADGGTFSSMGTAEEKSNDEAPLSADDQKLMSLKHVNQNMTSNDQVESNVRQTIEVQLGDTCEKSDSHASQEMEVKEDNSEDHHNSMDEKALKHMATKAGSSGGFCQANYILPPEKEGDFSVSDMVWGKVRSHPWWPGQIFDPSDASEKAMKHYKKDCFLVAYFGDRTFAWNEASQLKPFRAHFSNIEKQSNSESFHNAVDCAIDEVSRRVEFGLACSCVPKDIYDQVKFQTVENAGIQEETSLKHASDESLNADSFSPNKLLDYLESLSQCPTGGFDRLELGIAKAQLLAFYRLKGYSCLPEFQYCGGLDCDIDSSMQDVENNASEGNETPLSKDADQASAGHRVSKIHNSSYHKRKHNLKDGMYPKKKEKSLSELIGGTLDSPDDYWLDEKAIDSLVSPTASKKRRTVDPYADDPGMQDGRKTISVAKVSSSSKPSFKIGECIRRVASQLTGSPAVRSSGERPQKPDEDTDVLSGDASEDVSAQNLEEAKKPIDPADYSSLNDLLSLLQWAAQDPVEHCKFSSVIVSFFSDFRNSIVVGNYSEREITPPNKVGPKRKKQAIAGLPETFEFEDMSDTYWTDRVIQNGSEEQPSKRSRKKENQSVLPDPEKPVQVSRRSYSRKRYSDNSNVSNVEASEKPSGYIDDKSPAELVMNFAELDSVPSETNLNKMFRRFGPLKESETEVDTVGSRARVVFKKCADAEVAFNSAKKFNIFGAILVNYQLNYTPSALFKASTVATTHDQEMHLDLSNFEVNMV
ncbi:uncharacterized protein LOC114759314 [Neltuma alba]|uniref:uncharacterized protein LOC114759314 n=1 Tax=Neltuma alba TaxID=207710 RepID=UPI0010A57539|nr:uncharacterized protein LOC114759314 [Prosopis alba]